MKTEPNIIALCTDSIFTQDHEDYWSASINGRGIEIKGFGKSESEAIGNLVKSHPCCFHIGTREEIASFITPFAAA